MNLPNCAVCKWRGKAAFIWSLDSNPTCLAMGGKSQNKVWGTGNCHILFTLGDPIEKDTVTYSSSGLVGREKPEKRIKK
jgi:hypothetical protein